MHAEAPTSIPRWQRDVMLLLVAMVFAGEGLLADGTKSGDALMIVGALVALVAVVRLLVHVRPIGRR
jgi:hypothetical protein